MPPKKKGKKPKMTKAERKAMKALKKKLAQIQMKKDKMGREVKMTKENMPKVMDKHYPLMKEATVSRMKEDVKVMEQISKRIFDLKGHAIEILQEDIESAETQYMRQTRAHLGHMDHFIEIMQSRIKTLSEYYETERQRSCDHAKEVKEKVITTFDYEEERWNVAIYEVAKEHKEREINAAGEFLQKFEDMIDSLETQHDNMEGYFDSSLLKIWKSMQDYFQEYQRKTSARKQAYDKLLQLDAENSACIKYQAHWINSMMNQVQILKDQLKDCEIKYEKEIEDLKAEREEYISFYKSQKTGMRHGKSGDSLLLKDLAVCCHEEEKKLEKIKKTAEKILTLAQMCRALETEEEKVLLPKTLVNADMNKFRSHKPERNPHIKETMKTDSDQRESESSPDGQFFADMNIMQGFWARVGRANMLRGKLALEKQSLMTENDMLKDKLREFLLMQGAQNHCKCELDELISIHVPTHDYDQIKE
ncbi:dynein regulatory complex subunit 2-like [Ischnura elegans]|uniref:dynein regulatory complex subunit 2-like n=1 Tax=Ischnura elegans TaxID=197161 RepID=UPI001ED8B98F|nr:dynein regulatory complex subunit 2-like [Ischnura elegans]XP_046387776.1 dynein regulatory complex subunit 2-like [Ischnura elegans]XP_046387777.1 dynein regulatory complex subunit 2-like [Ischnura elegans]